MTPGSKLVVLERVWVRIMPNIMCHAVRKKGKAKPQFERIALFNRIFTIYKYEGSVKNTLFKR